MSQIGYMFVGAGVGAYSSAMFHLMTHAFFKALLFLAAGIVIHALTGEQDIRQAWAASGSVLPFTRTVFLIGSLALVGIPPFAGFFSKDSIIAATLARGAFGYLPLRGLPRSARSSPASTPSASTSSSSTASQSAFAREHLHKPQGRLEGPLSMVWTVSVLAVLSAVGGFLQFAPFWHPLTTWLDPVAAADRRADERAGGDRLDRRASRSASPASASPGRSTSRSASGRRRPVRLLEQKFYWDELYDAVFYRPCRPDRARPRPLRRAAADRRLDRARSRAASASARVSSRPRPERARPRLRARARERRRRPRRRLPRPRDERLADHDPDLPADRRRARRLARCRCRAYWLGSLATLVSLVEVGFWIVARRAVRLRLARRSSSPAARVVPRPRLSYHVGLFALLALARRADRGLLARGDASTRWWVGPRAAARLLRR